MVPFIEYCQTVSRRSMAISLDTAAFVWFMCVTRRAGSACDLGSGFTSYVLRRTRAEVTSVDDSEEWLERTGQFLARYGKSTGELLMWDEWQERTDTYDVVVHDFASGDLRESSMWVAADAVAPGGVLIFDDAQHAGHLAEMLRVAEAHDWVLYDIRGVTEDPVRRFAAMAAA